MSDEYLWDGSGTPPADVARLETLLGRLRAPLPPAPLVPASGGAAGSSFDRLRTSDMHIVRRGGARFLAPALAAAAVIALMVAGTWRSLDGSRSWEVAATAGVP